MASENLVKELWEIIQKENKEEISYNDFENDLNKVLNLPKDESDRAISLMISQAEVNPNLIGEYKGGSFAISSAFATKIVSTIKYENQFIPGKVEFDNRVLNENVKKDAAISAVILTPQLVDNMIGKYGELTDNEKEVLWDGYPSMDSSQRIALRKAREKELGNIANDEKQPQDVRDTADQMRRRSEQEGKLSQAAEDGSQTLLTARRVNLKNFQKANPQLFNTLFSDLAGLNLDEVSEEVINHAYLKYEKEYIMAEDEVLKQKRENPERTTKSGWNYRNTKRATDYAYRKYNEAENKVFMNIGRQGDQLFDVDVQVDFIQEFYENLSGLNLDSQRVSEILVEVKKAMQKIEQGTFVRNPDAKKMAELIFSRMSQETGISLEEVQMILGGKNAEIIATMITRDKNEFANVTLEVLLNKVKIENDFNRSKSVFDKNELKAMLEQRKRVQSALKTESETVLYDNEFTPIFESKGEDLYVDNQAMQDIDSMQDMLATMMSGIEKESESESKSESVPESLEVSSQIKEDSEPTIILDNDEQIDDRENSEENTVAKRTLKQQKYGDRINNIQKLISQKGKIDIDNFKCKKESNSSRKMRLIRAESKPKISITPELIKHIASVTRISVIKKEMQELQKFLPVRRREEVEAEVAEFGES